MKDKEKQTVAMELRLAGLTYAQIGLKIGLSRQRVQQIISPPPYIRRIVVNRAEGRCETCGIKVNGSGHVHHKSCAGEDYNDVDNLQLLCVSCHMKAHPRLLNGDEKAGNQDKISIRHINPGLFIEARAASIKEGKRIGDWINEAITAKLNSLR